MRKMVYILLFVFLFSVTAFAEEGNSSGGYSPPGGSKMSSVYYSDGTYVESGRPGDGNVTNEAGPALTSPSTAVSETLGAEVPTQQTEIPTFVTVQPTQPTVPETTLTIPETSPVMTEEETMTVEETMPTEEITEEVVEEINPYERIPEVGYKDKSGYAIAIIVNGALCLAYILTRRKNNACVYD